MTDRELLELAAKAYGLYGVDPVGDDALWADGERTHKNENDETVCEPCGMRTVCGVWNPLTDDGDTLRLAVKLGMQIAGRVWCPTGEYSYGSESGISIDFENYNDDSYAATRRAIVRAAAEIAKHGGKEE